MKPTSKKPILSTSILATRITLPLATAVAALFSTSSAMAQTNGTWTGAAGTGIWGGTGNWTGSAVASGIGATASFTAEYTTTQNVAVNTARTIGNITFTDTTSSHDLNINVHTTAFDLTLDVNSGSPTINVTQSDRTLTINNRLAGADGMTKTGPGTLTLTAANIYTGVTNVNAGMVVVSNATALGTTVGNTVIASGGRVAFSTTNLSVAEAFNINGTGTATNGALGFGGNATGMALTGAITLAGNSRIQGDGNTGATLSGGIDLGANTLTYNTDGGANHTISTAAITGAGGSLAKTGVGTLTLSGSNTYTGTTTVSAGTLLATRAVALSGYNSAAKVVFNGGIIAAQVGGSGWTTGEVDTLLSNATKTSGSLGIDTTNANLTQWTPFNTTNFGAALGLTKLGTNALTLNQANDYAGATTISAGTLRITNGSALGATTTGTTQSGTSALEIDGTGGAVTVGAEALSISGGGISNGGALRNIAGNNTYGGTITLAAQSRINSDSGTLLLNNATAISGAAQNLVIGGAGNINIAGAIATTSGFVSKDGAGTLTLSGLSDVAANNYTGATAINQGTVAISHPTTAALTGSLTFGSVAASASNGNFDLTAANATFTGTGIVQTNSTTANTINIGTAKTLTLNGGLTVGYAASSGSATNSRLTASGAGSIVVNGTNLNVGVSGTGTANSAWFNRAVLDVTGLTSFTTNVTNLNVGAGDNIVPTGDLLLSNTANTIQATTLKVGDTGTDNGTGTSTLTLGTGTNLIQADTIEIGKGKNTGPGVVKFASQTAGSPGTVTIANKAGTGAANITIGNVNGLATGGGGVGTLDLRGHVATVNAGTLLISNANGTNASFSSGTDGTVHFDAGTFTVATLNMGVKTGNSTGTATATLNVGGGNFTVNTAFNLGSQAGAGASSATVNITGGTFTSNVDIVGGAGTTTSTINLNGASATLDLAGDNITNVDNINFTNGTLKNLGIVNTGMSLAGTGSRVFDQGTGISGTIQGAITGTGVGLTKQGTGSLALGGLNTYNGPTAVTAGTLSLTGSLTGGGAVSTSGTGILSQSAAGVISGASSFTQGSSGSSVLAGVNTYNGTTEVNGGTLQISGAGSVNTSSGITINGSGAKLIQTSSAAISPTVTLTQGTLTGSGTVNTVNVGNATGGIVSNNNGVAGATFTIGSLTFDGAGTVNTFSNSTSAPIITTSLASNAAGTIIINPTSTSWTVGVPYDLISYGGGSIGGAGFSQFALGTVGNASPRQPKTLGNSGTAITLTVGAGDPVYWVGDGDGKWNLASTNNWKLLSNGNNTNFLAADDVLFDDNATAAGPITLDIDTANVATTTTTFNNSTKDYVLGGAFGISTGSLTKNGTGSVTITNANTYTGGTNINAGTLQIDNASALGTSGTIAFGGGTLRYGTGITTDLSSRFSNAASQSFRINTNGNNVTFATGLSSTGGTLTKDGAGSLILTAASSYTGATTINGGTLEVRSTISSSGITNDGVLIFNSASGQSFGNAIGGAGSLSKQGAGTLTLSGTNTYAGGTTISGGIVTAGSSSAFGSGAVAITGSGVRIVLADGVSISNNITIGTNAAASGRGIIEYGGATNATVTGGTMTINNIPLAGGHFASTSTGTLIIGHAINSSVPVSWRLGTGVFSGGGTYSDFSIGAGTIRLGANNGFSTSATLTIAVSGSANFDLAGFNQSVVGIVKSTNTAIIGNSSTTADSTLTTTGTSTYAGIIQDVISPGTRKVALAVNGGALTLTGANTYTGGTAVSNNGTLSSTITTTANALGSGAASVATGSTLLLNNTNTTSTAVAIANSFTGSGLLKLQFAAGTTARETTMSNVTGYNGTIQLSNLGAMGDKWNATGIGTVPGSVVVDSGSTLFAGTGAAVSFTGGITVNGAGNSEGRGAIRMANTTLGGNITLASSSTISMESTTGQLTGNINSSATGAILTLGATGSTGGTLSGNISDGTGTLTVTNAVGSYTLSGILSQSGGVNLSAGLLTLSNSSNSYTGVTAITGGANRSLLVTANNALGATGTGNETNIGSTGQLGFSGGITYSTTEKIIGSGAGNTSNNHGLFIVGNRGFIQSVSGNNTFAGDIELNANGLSRIGTQDGARLTLTGAITQGNSITTASILFRTGNTNGDFVTITNPNNSFGGDTTVFTSLATAGQYSGLRIGADNAHPTNLTVTNFSTASGTSTSLDLNGKQQTLNGLTNGGLGTLNIINLDTANASTLTLNPTSNRTNASTVTILGGAPGGTTLGTINVVKSGAFTQTLVGTHSYTGTTAVNGGTLLVNGSISGSTTSVNTTGTLGGSGTVGALTVNGGTLAPGNSPGILNAGNTTFSGGTAAYEIFGTTAGNLANNYDQLNVTGTVTFTADTALTISLGVFDPVDFTDSFILINNDSTDTISLGGFGFTYLGDQLTEGEIFTTTEGQAFTITYAGGTDANDVIISAVPEPGSALMLAGGLATLLGFRRRRSA